jgi:phosphatidylcholine synthase
VSREEALRSAAALVHVFTALGAACALFAALAVAERSWEMVFVWLGVALIVDAIDGPMARWFGVKKELPRFSGDRLDLVVDYVTYVFVPVLALLQAGFLTGWFGMVLAVGVLLSSLYHFSDVGSKDKDNAFVGFPAIWNLVAFYFFALEASVPVAGAITMLCIALTFVPSRWVHPVRVVFLRPLTAAVTGAWTVAAIVATWKGFPADPATGAVLLAVAVYFVALSLFWSRLGGRAT